jgi:RNA polymerase sigma-70 factor, ECF subfamily
MDTSPNRPTSDRFDPDLNRYRSYLLLLARMQLETSPRLKIEASDIVQLTLLEAHVKRQQFVGDGEAFAAWLRKALANNIRDGLRRARRQRRDAMREQSLEEAINNSSAIMAAYLVSDHTSLRQRAIRNEDLLRMSNALLELPDAQRDAVIMHHLQGCKLAEVAQQLQRTEAAVAGLLHRGLRRLREMMLETDQEA